MSNRHYIPFSWFKTHFIGDILANWQRAAVSENGFFHPELNRDWSRSGEPVGTLVSQARLLFVFSVGYQLTKDPELRRIVNAGGRFLIDAFSDQEEGGMFWCCTDSGEVVDDTKDAYGHAFVLLGLTHAFKATGQIAFLGKAVQIYEILVTRFRDHLGGMTWKMSRNWEDKDLTRSQNPIMHTFESLLSLLDIAEDEELKRSIRKELQELVEFLFFRLKGKTNWILPEIYSKTWEPLSSDKGGYCSAGHFFEWVFLLSEGVKNGLPESYLGLAEDLLEAGLDMGYNKELNYIYTWIDEKGNVIRDEISWWEQSEALRALIHYIINYYRNDLIDPFQSLLKFVKRHFLDPEYGGWYATLDSGRLPVDMNKGGLYKLDYHQTGLCLEVFRNRERN